MHRRNNVALRLSWVAVLSTILPGSWNCGSSNSGAIEIRQAGSEGVISRVSGDLSLPEGERPIDLADEILLREQTGSPVLFERVLQASLTDSTVLVLDQDGQLRIRRFENLSGGELESSAAIGEGGRVDAITPLEEGRILAWDRRREELWVLHGPGKSDGPMRADLKLHPKSDLEVWGDTVWLRSVVSGGVESPTIKEEARAFSLGGDLLESVELPEIIRHDCRFFLYGSSGGLENFARLRLVEWSPRHGLLFGENADYGFGIQRGDTVINVRVDYSPPALDEVEYQYWVRRAAEFSAMSSTMEYTVPREKPAYRSLGWDRDGRVWVWRYVRGVPRDSISAIFPAGSDPMPIIEPVTLDIFDRDGGYVGTVRLPPRSRVVGIHGERVAIATRYASMGNKERLRVFRLGMSG